MGATHLSTNKPKLSPMSCTRHQEQIAASLTAGVLVANGGLVSIIDAVMTYRAVLAELRKPSKSI